MRVGDTVKVCDFEVRPFSLRSLTVSVIVTLVVAETSGVTQAIDEEFREVRLPMLPLLALAIHE